MSDKHIYVVGIGPGDADMMTVEARRVLSECDVVVGYRLYLDLIKPLLRDDVTLIESPMRQELGRASRAFEQARQGLKVAMVSSGDSTVYGMAPLIVEMGVRHYPDVEVTVVPGVSAFQAASALLGAAVGHDFCTISLSDLLTPWSTIERRIAGAAQGDFVTAIYNPRSIGRFWQLVRLREVFLQYRDPSTPVGVVRNACRDGQTVTLTTLADLDVDTVDMFTMLIVGNAETYVADGRMITPRGYDRKTAKPETRPGAAIMQQSFRTILSRMEVPDRDHAVLWPMLHAIHTTADFEMEHLLNVAPDTLPAIYNAMADGRIRTIVTDVTMAASGIRRAAAERLGVEIKCYLSDPRAVEMAAIQGITRSQAGIRLAVADDPGALFVFGNAPTALIELCSLISHGKANPGGIVAAPVGFVNVLESKHMVKAFPSIPKIIVEGNKGGSTLAATLVNSILSWPDAAELKPGRDV